MTRIRSVYACVCRMKATKRKALHPEVHEVSKSFRRMLSLTALFLLCLCASMRASEQVPFKGSFNLTFVSIAQPDPFHLRATMQVNVLATHLGAAEGPATVLLDLNTFSYVGEATWTGANGDAIFVTFAGQFVPTDTYGVLANIETIEIVGGTGRFEGATGSCLAGGRLEAGTLTPLEPAPFEGTISSPGSLKK